MNIQKNTKRPFYQEHIPLLDDDFDLFSQEVVDFKFLYMSPLGDEGYVMEFKNQAR